MSEWAIECLKPDLPSVETYTSLLAEMDSNQWYTNFGPFVQKFEAKMAQFLSSTDGAPLNVVSCNNATSALELMLQNSGLPKGAKVMVPSVTFPATILAVIRSEMEPVIADVCEEEWTLTPAGVEAMLDYCDIDAVMPVASFGYALDSRAWEAFIDRTGIPVFFDSAAALGQQEVSPKIPTVFSMHATKPFGIGEGGLIVTASDAMASSSKLNSNFGFVQGLIKDIGFNAKLAEYFAIVGLTQFERWDAVTLKREQRWALYKECIDTLDTVDYCQAHKNKLPATLMVNTQGRSAAVIKTCIENKIQTRQWYLPPLHKHEIFQSYIKVGLQGLDKCPVSEYLESSLVGIPFHNFLTNEQIHHICAIIK
ncbi:DegT/DnrJ/EryC1/StrS family aminotransferase [Temperatibacter marinus]|uniref:DegT/DnrJ/EryC1/StrS family aminotransferase n=1 Tax=Temperatibacter marinus TaxID=1456591 RepID=A0AA52EHF1_9PROT|nr:DegT/DnrJ/EryC1/StrS family aminotransferase [Temperatibacter marinus]WND03213.1 DegT/DnrJ/EryC1/StrS family aminotransferase [Temperatibacter marinus]